MRSQKIAAVKVHRHNTITKHHLMLPRRKQRQKIENIRAKAQITNYGTKNSGTSSFRPTDNINNTKTKHHQPTTKNYGHEVTKSKSETPSTTNTTKKTNFQGVTRADNAERENNPRRHRVTDNNYGTQQQQTSKMCIF